MDGGTTGNGLGDTVGDGLTGTAGDGLTDTAGEAVGDVAGLGEGVADEPRDGPCVAVGVPAGVVPLLGVLIPGTAPGVPVGVATTLLPGEG